MRSTSLFDLLPDFGAHAALAESNPAADLGMNPTADMPAPVDVDALVAEAVEKAEAALAERLTAQHAEELEALQHAEAEKTAIFMESLGRDMGESIAVAIDAMEARVADTIGDAVARMLGSVLGDDLRKRALAALSQTIGETVRDAEAVRIRVSGPLSLYEPLKAALGPQAANLDFTEAEGFDLTMSIDDVVFETRMSEWASALDEVLS